MSAKSLKRNKSSRSVHRTRKRAVNKLARRTAKKYPEMGAYGPRNHGLQMGDDT